MTSCEQQGVSAATQARELQRRALESGLYGADKQKMLDLAEEIWGKTFGDKGRLSLQDTPRGIRSGDRWAYQHGLEQAAADHNVDVGTAQAVPWYMKKEVDRTLGVRSPEGNAIAGLQKAADQAKATGTPWDTQRAMFDMDRKTAVEYMKKRVAPLKDGKPEDVKKLSDRAVQHLLDRGVIKRSDIPKAMRSRF